MATPEVPEVSEVSERPIPAPGTYEIEPAASTVRFETRAMFGVLPVRGTLPVGHGRISVAEAVEGSSVEVTMDAAGFESGNQKRDEHVRSADYLDASGHPEIAFRSRRLDRSTTDTLHGELTVRGVTSPVAVTLDTVSLDDSRRIEAHGTATIDRYAFGITKAKGMTGRHLEVTVDVVANR